MTDNLKFLTLPRRTPQKAAAAVCLRDYREIYSRAWRSIHGANFKV